MNADDFAGSLDQEGRKWPAFRYVLGEMLPEEEAAFEQALESDQAARELVAEAARLVESLYLAEAGQPEPIAPGVPAARRGSDDGPFRTAELPSPLPVSRRTSVESRSGRRWAIIAAAAAVCLSLALGLRVLSTRGPNNVLRGLEDSAAVNSADNGAGLVAFWSEWFEQSPPDAATAEVSATERGDAAAAGEADDARTHATGENTPADRTSADSVATSDPMGKDPVAKDDFRVPGWLIAAVSIGENRTPDAAEIREN